LWLEAWPSLRITTLERSISELEALVEHPAGDQPDEVSRALARFLVIRTSGFLEQVARECCTAYVRSKSSPQAGAYGASWLELGTNPLPDRLVRLVRRFDGGWAEELSALLEQDDELLKRELSLLVDRRNKIAHGEGEGMGARKALDLLKMTRQVTGWFVVKFDPR
jgi:hypothetical protein